MATVLVVDDDPISREFLRTLLGYRGHRTCEAADGDSALALAGRQPPDAVITDVLMPGLDGYELARMLRSRPATSDIPIAFSTAHYGQQEIGPLARACGVQDVIFKPAQPTDVLATIDALLTADRIRGRAPDGGDAAQPGIDARLRRAGAVSLGEGRLHAIAATAPVGVLLADGAGRAYFVNSRLVQMLGRPESELLDLGWLDHIEPAGRERLVAAVATGAIRDGRPHRVASTPTGPEPRWFDICLYPIDETGAVAAMACRRPAPSRIAVARSSRPVVATTRSVASRASIVARTSIGCAGLKITSWTPQAWTNGQISCHP